MLPILLQSNSLIRKLQTDSTVSMLPTEMIYLSMLMELTVSQSSKKLEDVRYSRELKEYQLLS